MKKEKLAVSANEAKWNANSMAVAKPEDEKSPYINERWPIYNQPGMVSGFSIEISNLENDEYRVRIGKYVGVLKKEDKEMP